MVPCLVGVCDAALIGKWTQDWPSPAGDNCPEEVRRRVPLPEPFTEAQLVESVHSCDLAAVHVADATWGPDL